MEAIVGKIIRTLVALFFLFCMVGTQPVFAQNTITETPEPEATQVSIPTELLPDAHLEEPIITETPEPEATEEPVVTETASAIAPSIAMNGTASPEPTRGVGILMETGAPVGTGQENVYSDQEDYEPGSVVTLSGDGYTFGETVHVDVAGPNSYTADCDVIVNALGGVVLPGNPLVNLAGDRQLFIYSHFVFRQC